MSFAFTLRQSSVQLGRRLPLSSACCFTASVPSRAFRSAAKHATSPARRTAAASPLAWAPLKNTLARDTTVRWYQQAAQESRPSGSTMRNLIFGGAVFGGTLVAINVVFNRETRDDPAMPAYERRYLNETFMHTGLGLGIIGLTARQMLKSGFAFRLMVTNPWIVAIGGLALSFGTMIPAKTISPDNYVPKYAFWTAFNATQAALIAPMVAFVPAALVARAGLYTLAMMGSISFVGATAKQDKYLYLGGPLLAGVAIVAVSGLAPLIIPATAVRTLAVTESLWLYGGLAVFGGFTLYDIQKILYHARLAERGALKRDPVSESINLELDFLNIFIRMMQILMMQNNRKK